MFHQNTKWITSGKTNDKTCSLPPETYRKNFTIENLPKKATLTITALGIYDVSINDKKVSDYFFAPGYTNYKKHIQVQEYDVTELLMRGNNVIEIMVANGWYLGRNRTGWFVLSRRGGHGQLQPLRIRHGGRLFLP